MSMKYKNDFFLFWKPQEKKLSKRKKLSYSIKCFFWRFVLRLKYISSSQKKYNVAICGIFKNEGYYLKEWIEYHRLVGIEHFYLYNNNSDDNFKSVVQDYINDGIVTLIDWPFNQAQMEAYIDCIKQFSEETKWIGFIDIDEFVVPKKFNDIKSILSRYEKTRGSILFYWKFFGSGGLRYRDKKSLVIQDFVKATDRYCNIGKCFYNTNFSFSYRRLGGLHHMLYTNVCMIDIPPVDTYGNFVLDSYCPEPIADFDIQINHYAIKSFDEYKDRFSKGDVYYKTNPHTEQKFYEIDSLCVSYDYAISKYINLLKENMV